MAQMNPSVGDVETNLLKAGYHNEQYNIRWCHEKFDLQLRSDPPIAKETVSPFLQSTIDISI